MEGPQNVQKNPRKRKHPENSGDIVFTKNGTVQTIPSMNKRLKTVTEPVIGLQYIWEYRSPSKSVPPHYQCRLCKVERLSIEMVSHITGWKHCFQYIKHHHSDKITADEEATAKDPSIRKAVKAAAAEVEKAEGRGQLKVVIKEPADIAVFQNMKTARPSGGGVAGLLGPLPKGLRLDGPLGGGFAEPPFHPQGDFRPDFSPGLRSVLDELPMRRAPPDLGDFSSPGGRYGDSMGGPDRLHGGPDRLLQQQRFSNNGPVRMGPDGFGMDRPYPNDLPMNTRSDQMFRDGPKAPEANSTLATLLRFLDTFRIESEDDAQIVLKVTQKLTDVLMEYRLRSISSVPSMNSASSLSSLLPSRSNDRFSGNMSGSSRFYN